MFLKHRLEYLDRLRALLESYLCGRGQRVWIQSPCSFPELPVAVQDVHGDSVLFEAPRESVIQQSDTWLQPNRKGHIHERRLSHSARNLAEVATRA